MNNSIQKVFLSYEDEQRIRAEWYAVGQYDLTKADDDPAIVCMIMMAFSLTSLVMYGIAFVGY